jgi:hypothetical protein
MKPINFKERYIEFLILLVGTICIIMGCFIKDTGGTILVSIGCSLAASAIVAGVNNFYNESENVLKAWGVDKVYKTRAEKSKDSDPKLTKAHDHLDIVAFGLKSFRSGHRSEILQCLMNGVNIRIITMDPDSTNAQNRASEEGETIEQIAHSINDLIEWCKILNRDAKKKSAKAGQIRIMKYKCMTLDFYWRCDDELYFGPYLLGKDSQQTVTFRAIKGGKLFDMYTEYFEELWQNGEFMEEVPME